VRLSLWGEVGAGLADLVHQGWHVSHKTLLRSRALVCLSPVILGMIHSRWISAQRLSTIHLAVRPPLQLDQNSPGDCIVLSQCQRWCSAVLYCGRGRLIRLRVKTCHCHVHMHSQLQRCFFVVLIGTFDAVVTAMIVLQLARQDLGSPAALPLHSGGT
jgi:hypothetical protein